VARNGDIVVALVNGSEATLKRFYQEADGRVRLQPANPAMSAMVLPAEAVQVQGRLIGVLRRY
jgi:repressor LexA